VSAVRPQGLALRRPTQLARQVGAECRRPPRASRIDPAGSIAASCAVGGSARVSRATAVPVPAIRRETATPLRFPGRHRVSVRCIRARVLTDPKGWPREPGPNFGHGRASRSGHAHSVSRDGALAGFDRLARARVTRPASYRRVRALSCSSYSAAASPDARASARTAKISN
jgi:hypothetical protein